MDKPKKIYEMDDSYKQAVADLLELIEVRDELAEALKVASPDKLREGQELLVEMDKKIEDCEAALAKEYESYQTHRRAEEDLEVATEEMVERMAMVFIHYKYNHPHKLEEIRAAVLHNYTPEEEQDFYDRVAILEATKLEEIIATGKRQ